MRCSHSGSAFCDLAFSQGATNSCGVQLPASSSFQGECSGVRRSLGHERAHRRGVGIVERGMNSGVGEPREGVEKSPSRRCIIACQNAPVRDLICCEMVCDASKSSFNKKQTGATLAVFRVARRFRHLRRIAHRHRIPQLFSKVLAARFALGKAVRAAHDFGVVAKLYLEHEC